MRRAVYTSALLLTVCTGCSGNPGVPQPAEQPDKRNTVIYEVGGDVGYASYDDNYENGIEYPAGITRIELSGDDVPQSPKLLYTWANTEGGRTGEAWCRITVDGSVVKEDRRVGEANDPTCLYPEP